MRCPRSRKHPDKLFATRQDAGRWPRAVALNFARPIRVVDTVAAVDQQKFATERVYSEPVLAYRVISLRRRLGRYRAYQTATATTDFHETDIPKGRGRAVPAQT